MRRRLEEYHKQTSVLSKYYQDAVKFEKNAPRYIAVDGCRKIEDIASDILEKLAGS